MHRRVRESFVNLLFCLVLEWFDLVDCEKSVYVVTGLLVLYIAVNRKYCEESGTYDYPTYPFLLAMAILGSFRHYSLKERVMIGEAAILAMTFCDLLDYVVISENGIYLQRRQRQEAIESGCPGH